MDSSGLKFKSFDQLLQHATLKEQQVRQFEQTPIERVFTTVKKMKDEAVKARGDLEEQYRLYLIAGEISGLMTKSAGFKKWATDPANSMLFKTIYNEVIVGASNIQSTLKIKYESAQVRRDKFDRAEKHEAEKRGAATNTVPTGTMRSLRALITPRELIRKVENEDPKKTAMIFDLRQDQTDAIFYNRSEMITVIQVPYDLIDSSLTFNKLKSNLPVNQRALLPRLTGSDYVVLMDDESPDLVNNSPAAKTKMAFLFKALTQYNPTERPKDRPMFMDGGFKMWKAQYPTLTKNEQPVSARSLPSDDLDQAILAYTSKAHGISEIRYPNLMDRSLDGMPPGQPISPPRQPLIPPRPNEIPAEPKAYPNVPTIPQRPSLPPFDRPGPPVFSPGPNVPSGKPFQPPPQPPAPVFPIPDRTSKPHHTMPERPTDPSPTRGGGEPRQNGGGVDLKRPPLLDRNTKPSNVLSCRKADEAKLLSIYDQMIMAIDRSIDDRTKSRGSGIPGAVGLYNMGNTCFMSATLQCLFQTPGLPEVFTKRKFVGNLNTQNGFGSKGVISAGFASLLDTIWNGTFVAIRPARFLQLFADEVYQSLNDGRQHDASEFQLFLLDALHEDTNKAPRVSFEQNYKGGQGIRIDAEDFLKRQRHFTFSPVNDILGTISVSEVRCETCGESSATFESSTIVSVELLSTSSCTLDNCLRSHFSTTTLDGDSCWNCPRCKQPRKSTRTSKLWRPPQVLVIHLKRFALFYGDFEKNTASVQFEPASFDVSPYMHPSAPKEKPFYKLYAATLHNGRLNSGHYTTVASHLRSDKWYRYDDDKVTPCDRFQVDSSLAYILFYKRC